MSYPTPASSPPLESGSENISEFRMNVEDEEQRQGAGARAGEVVLEATAAPRSRSFPRPTRRGRGRSADPSTSPLLSPSPSSGPGSPVRSRSRSRSSSRDLSPSPSSLSSRSQSMLRAPHPYDDESVGVLFSDDDDGGGGGGGDTEAVLGRFVEIQKEHDEKCKWYEEEIRDLRHEVRKLAGQSNDQEEWIRHVEARAEELEEKNKQLEKESGILMVQLQAKEREVRALTQEVKQVESVVIFDKDPSKPMTPNQANSRLKQLREEIAQLKEDRDRQGEDLEVLWEKKEQAEELQKENETLRKETMSLKKEVELIEKKLEVERQAIKKYEGPAERKLARAQTIRDSPDPNSRAEIEELMRAIDDLKTKHEKEEESLLIKIQEADEKIKVKDDEIQKLHVDAATAVEQIPQLQEQVAQYKEQIAQLKERHEAKLKELDDELRGYEEKLALQEEALTREKERHEARENIWKLDERDLTSQLQQLERSDRKEVEELRREIEEDNKEKEEKIAELMQGNEALATKNEELSKHNKHLQQAVRSYRRGGADLPIRQTIANTQLWAERNIMRESLDNVRDRIKKIDFDQLQEAAKLIEDTKHSLETTFPGDDTRTLAQKLGDVQRVLQDRLQPLKAISGELKQTKDRLKKEKEAWAKEDGEITSILRRIEGRGSPEHKRRSFHHLSDAQSEFMKEIEALEAEQNRYITSKHEEYSDIKAKRPLGAPLKPEEDKKLHELTREFVEKLPENAMVAFLGGDTPQVRRRNQLWALTEKVKRLKTREGQDLHTWLPKIKPTIMEHKQRHAQLVKELHELENEAEDLVQQINELTRPPDLLPRGRSPIPRGEQQRQQQQPQEEAPPPAGNLEEIRKQEADLRKKEEQIRREARVAYSRLERLLYNRQLFEHWVDTLEKRLNSEAAGLVTQVLLEFELRNLLDKESKEACFCSLLEYFFPKVYAATVRGRAPHSPEKEKPAPVSLVEKGGENIKPRVPKSRPGSAYLLGRAETIDLRELSRGQRSNRSKTAGKGLGRTPTLGVGTPAGVGNTDDDDDVAVRSMAPPRRGARAFDLFTASPLSRPTSFHGGEGGNSAGGGRSAVIGGGRRMDTFDDKEDYYLAGPADSSPGNDKDPRHGHGDSHLYISPPTAQLFTQHAYPYICQVLTSLLWFVLLLAIQPVNMFRTFSFILAFVVGLPVYLVQFSLFYLAERCGPLYSGLASRLEGIRGTLGPFRRRRRGLKLEGEQEKEREEKPVLVAEQPGLRGSQGQGEGNNIVTSKYINLFEEDTPSRAGLGILVPDPQAGDTSSAKGKKKEELAGSESLQPLVVETDLKLRGGGGKGRGGRRSKWRLKRELIVDDDLEPGALDVPLTEEEEAGRRLIEAGRLSPLTPVQVGSPPLPGWLAESSEVKYKGKDEGKDKGKEKEEHAVSEDGIGDEPANSPSPAFADLDTGSMVKGEVDTVSSAGPGFFQPPERREAATEIGGSMKEKEEESTGRLSQEVRGSEAEWPASAGKEIGGEVEADIPSRKQSWWWRMWIWVTGAWACLCSSISVYWPFSRRDSKHKKAPTTPPSQRRPGGDDEGGNKSPSPLKWLYTAPKWASSVFPGAQAMPDITISSPSSVGTKSGEDEDDHRAPPEPWIWSRWWASFRAMIDLLAAKKFPLIVTRGRNLCNAGFSKLTSLFSCLTNLLRRVFASILTFLRKTVRYYPARASQNLRARLLPASPVKLHVPKTNLRLDKIRPPNIDLPKVDLPAHSKLPKLSTKINIPGINSLNIPSLQNIPKVALPRPPSPPTILGSLVSLFFIYTILIYLACIQERRVWASANTTWKHAYLRDLELSRAAAEVQTHAMAYSQSQAPLGWACTIRSALTRSSAAYASPRSEMGSTAYPGWSPAVVDFRLVYAPLWWWIWYAPGDLASWGIEKGGQVWNWAAVVYGQGIEEAVTDLGKKVDDFRESSATGFEESMEGLWHSFEGVGGSFQALSESVKGLGKDAGLWLRDKFAEVKQKSKQISARGYVDSESLGRVWIPGLLRRWWRGVQRAWRNQMIRFWETNDWVHERAGEAEREVRAFAYQFGRRVRGLTD